MPRPCGHAGAVPGCRVCFWCSDPSEKGRAYRARWGEPEPAPPAMPPPAEPAWKRRMALATACVYRGLPVGRTVGCDECGARHTVLPVLACPLHGACTERVSKDRSLASCRRCPDRTPPPPAPAAAPMPADDLPPLEDTVRNLLFHLYPVQGNGAWQWNVDELCKRLGLFNGKVVVAVALDPPSGRRADPTGLQPPDGARHRGPCATLDQVRARFGRRAARVEFVVVENDPHLREVASFEALFSRVETTDPRHVTLYAQAKGTTRRPGHTALPWAQILYEAHLDHWPLAHEQLRAHPVTGCFRKHGRGWHREQSASDWHYSGSWAAFRNRDLFSRPDWRRIDRFWSGIEPYWSLHFPYSRSGVLFHEGPVGRVNLYSGAYLRGKVAPAFEAWKRAHAKHRRDWP